MRRIPTLRAKAAHFAYHWYRHLVLHMAGTCVQGGTPLQ